MQIETPLATPQYMLAFLNDELPINGDDPHETCLEAYAAIESFQFEASKTELERRSASYGVGHDDMR